METIWPRERASRPHASTGIGWHAVMLASLLSGVWLLATRTVHRLIIDQMSEGEFLLFLLLIVPVFGVVSLWSAVYWRLGQPRGWCRADWALRVNLFAAATFLVAPISRPLDLMDFHLHYAERMEVVRLVESGKLWSGSPYIQLVPLPREYPTSVSNAAGQRQIVVYREDDAPHVVFYIHPGLHNESSAFLYRSDGRPPSLPNRVLPTARRSEPVADRWHRVIFQR